MTTRIGTGGPNTGVSASATAPRVTPAPGQPFRQIMHAGAGAILNGAEQAVTRLPGGPILAAALRPSAGAVAADPTGGTATRSLSPEGSPGTGSTGVGDLESAASQPGLESALDAGNNQNMRFLALQVRINGESREYSAYSNVLKAHHDTVKNAIGNIR